MCILSQIYEMVKGECFVKGITKGIRSALDIRIHLHRDLQ